MFMLQQDEIDDIGSFYEELECVFNNFSKYHIKILLGGFSAKVGREDIFKQKIGNEISHKISNDNAVSVVNFATSRNLSKIQCSHVVTFSNLLDIS
jgi:hypothetical protein